MALVLSLIYYYNYYNAEVKRELKRESDYIVSGISSYGESYLYGLDTQDLRVSVIDSSGILLFDSHIENISEAENYLNREEIREASNGGDGYSVRNSQSLNKSYLYYAVELSDGNFLRVSLEYRTVFSVAFDFLGTTILMLLVFALVAILISRGISQSIVRPINEMDLDHPEKAEIYEELRPALARISLQNLKIKRQMEELTLRENEFVSITSSMSEGMMILNSRGEILSFNESARAFFGQELRISGSILSLNISRKIRDAILTAMAGKTGYDDTAVGEKHYSVIATPVVRDETVEGAVILIIDDTEKEEREALRREFTSNVSHELKTPLTAISGFSELIASGIAVEEDAKRFAENIGREAKRLISLVGDIIRLTRLDGGEIPYDGKIDLYSVCEDIVERLSPVAEKAQMSLELTGERCLVNGNDDILNEIVYNLVDNGIKYNNQGGFVKLSVQKAGKNVIISVKDNGIGIPKDKQDRVFERFYRVDKSHSREIGGTGLGLSIVKHAVAYHKGEISLSSTEGEGTEVTVRFESAEDVTE